jgi:hypothetical protein
MLHFQKLDVYQCSIDFVACGLGLPTSPRCLVGSAEHAEGCGGTMRADKAKHYAIARGSAMESASHLDVMRVDELIDTELYARGIELLERIVAMLTKLIDP